MKIKYDMNDGYFDIYNESMGIYKDRISIRKKSDYKLKSYMSTYYRSLIIYLLSMIISLYMIVIKQENLVFWNIALVVMTLFLISLIIILFKQFKILKKMDHSGEMDFSDKGIWDISKHSKSFWKWDIIDFVVVGKYAYTFVMKEFPYVFSLPISLKKEIDVALKKYGDKIEVIDKRIK